MTCCDSYVLYRARGVRFSYTEGRVRTAALNGVDADIARGEFVCFSGPSGSGKSTLLNLLGLIESLQDGEIEFASQPLVALSEKEKNHLRRYLIGFVFQQFGIEKKGYVLRERLAGRPQRRRPQSGSWPKRSSHQSSAS